MGTSISSALEQAKDDNAVLEQLQTLDMMMANKIAAESTQMKDDAVQDNSLPIVAIVDTSEKYSVKVESVPADQINGAIEGILSGNFLGGLGDLVSVAVKELLGDKTAGEKSKKEFHVVFARITASCESTTCSTNTILPPTDSSTNSRTDSATMHKLASSTLRR